MITLASVTPEIILAETKKLQYLYGLKREIRYAQTRAPEDSTESVAEHIYGMHICAMYFLPLEDPQGSLDRTRIYEMINVHDLDEIETGDVLGYLKNDAIRAAEANAMQVLLEKSPEHMRVILEQTDKEYTSQTTREAQFVKAIDKFEPLIHIFNELGRKIVKTNKTTVENSAIIKEKFIQPFPIMYKFYQVIHEQMVAKDFFYIPK